MTLLEWFDQLDRSMFTFVHRDMAMPGLDWFFLLLRQGSTWIPLYAFMLYWSIRYARPYLVRFALLSIACTSLCDYISSSLLKPLFGRLRPCHDEALEPIMRNIINCAGLYAMPSGHATNHFGLATFWFFSILLMKGKKWHWLWFWAGLICFAQVYVGKHYPFDILAGAALGTFIGFVLYKIFERWVKPVASLQ